jgi:hypothetical protein
MIVAHGRSSGFIYRGSKVVPLSVSLTVDNQERKQGGAFMPLVQLVVVLIVIGVLLGLINRYIPMAGSIKSILNGVVVICVVLWLLNVFGLFSSLSAIHVGKMSWLGANGA